MHGLAAGVRVRMRGCATDTTNKRKEVAMNEESVAGQEKVVDATGTHEVTGLPGTPVPDPGTDTTAVAETNSGAAPVPEMLTPAQMTLLAFLVGNPNVEAGAAAAGVSRATAFRWVKEPLFQALLTRQRNELFLDTLAAVKTHATQAVTQLAGMLNANDESLRRKVCTDVLDRAMKVHNLQDLHERVAVLERESAERKLSQPQV